MGSNLRIAGVMLMTGAALTVVFMVLVGLVFIEQTIGLHTMAFTGDIDLLILLALIGGPVLVIASHGALGADDVDRPALLDHVRQCGLLYLLLAATLVYLVDQYDAGWGGLGYGYAVLLAAGLFEAIIIHAMVTARVKRRTLFPR
jgi:hypothetical protein